MGSCDEWQGILREIARPLDLYGVFEIQGDLVHAPRRSFATYRYRIHPAGFSYDGDLFVREDFRKQGWGRKLVQLREEFCRRIGIERIIIHQPNRPFWEKMGYEDLPAPEEHLLYRRFGVETRRPMWKVL